MIFAIEEASADRESGSAIGSFPNQLENRTTLPNRTNHCLMEQCLDGSNRPFHPEGLESELKANALFLLRMILTFY